jgi:hypothetical protein
MHAPLAKGSQLALQLCEGLTGLGINQLGFGVQGFRVEGVGSYLALQLREGLGLLLCCCRHVLPQVADVRCLSRQLPLQPLNLGVQVGAGCDSILPAEKYHTVLAVSRCDAVFYSESVPHGDSGQWVPHIAVISVSSTLVPADWDAATLVIPWLPRGCRTRPTVLGLLPYHRRFIFI